MRKRLIIMFLLNAILVNFIVAWPGDSATLGGATYTTSSSSRHFETALDEITDFINANYTVADIVKYSERVYTSNWKKYRGLKTSVIIRNNDMDIKIMMVVEQRLPRFFYRKGDGDLRIAMDYLSYPYDYDRHEYDEYRTYCIGIEKNIDDYMQENEWTCESRDFAFDHYLKQNADAERRRISSSARIEVNMKGKVFKEPVGASMFHVERKNELILINFRTRFYRPDTPKELIEQMQFHIANIPEVLKGLDFVFRAPLGRGEVYDINANGDKMSLFSDTERSLREVNIATYINDDEIDKVLEFNLEHFDFPVNGAERAYTPAMSWLTKQMKKIYNEWQKGKD